LRTVLFYPLSSLENNFSFRIDLDRHLFSFSEVC
jgi:hypothetical protein